MLLRTQYRARNPLKRFLHVEKKNIEALGFKIPPPNKPAGNYVGFVKSGKMLYLSGHLPWRDGKFYTDPQNLITGKVGKDVSVEEAKQAACSAALALCGTLKDAVGDLDKVRIVKVFGIVNCVDGFTAQPTVMNGASDFLVKVFGEEKGKHARSAIGTNALPLNVPVEIEMIAEIE